MFEIVNNLIQFKVLIIFEICTVFADGQSPLGAAAQLWPGSVPVYVSR